MFQELSNDIKNFYKPLSFDPWNCSLKFRESKGTPSPKVGVGLGVWRFTPSYSLTLSYIPRSMWCDSRASSWPTPLRLLCLDSRGCYLLMHYYLTIQLFEFNYKFKFTYNFHFDDMCNYQKWELDVEISILAMVGVDYGGG